jgi:hypothetical protein
MSIKGLFNIFKSTPKLMKSNGMIRGTKELFKSVYKEEGLTSSIFTGVGFTAGFACPGGVLFGPLAGFCGAVSGSLLEKGGRAGIKAIKKGVSIFAR